MNKEPTFSQIANLGIDLKVNMWFEPMIHNIILRKSQYKTILYEYKSRNWRMVARDLIGNKKPCLPAQCMHMQWIFCLREKLTNLFIWQQLRLPAEAHYYLQAPLAALAWFSAPEHLFDNSLFIFTTSHLLNISDPRRKCFKLQGPHLPQRICSMTVWTSRQTSRNSNLPTRWFLWWKQWTCMRVQIPMTLQSSSMLSALLLSSVMWWNEQFTAKNDEG